MLARKVWMPYCKAPMSRADKQRKRQKRKEKRLRQQSTRQQGDVDTPLRPVAVGQYIITYEPIKEEKSAARDIDEILGDEDRLRLFECIHETPERADRKSVVVGKSVDLGGGRFI